MKNPSARMLTLTMCCLASLALSSCAELTVGPRVETRYVIPHAGKPMVVLANQKIMGRLLEGTGDAVEQDVGGWVMMPQDHWDAVQRKLDSYEKRIAELEALKK